MRNKFLNTGQPGFHPLRKINVALRGLRFAVVADFSVAYKLVLSLLVLIACIAFREWIDVAAVLIATALMLVAEIFNTAIEALCDFLEVTTMKKSASSRTSPLPLWASAFLYG